MCIKQLENRDMRRKGEREREREAHGLSELGEAGQVKRLSLSLSLSVCSRVRVWMWVRCIADTSEIRELQSSACLPTY
jgi:hypothetical protein